MMSQPRIRTARTDERDRVLSTLTLAFATDPVIRWVFPEAREFLRRYPGFADAFSGLAVDQGTAYVTDGLEAVAMWLAPDAEIDQERLQAYAAEHFPPAALEAFGPVMEQLARYHPQEAWYLPFIGVDVNHQRQGLGAALLKTMTRQLDETGSLAYLESTNPANISLYQRHGFEVMGEVQAGGSPVFTPMLRRPA
jgi:ribosomal protein S18 acetylase RimI-like enzyme